MTHLKFFLTHAKEKHRDTKDKKLYWGMIQMEITDFCIRFSKPVAKAKRKREIDLLCKLKQLNERLDQNHQDTNLAVEAEHGERNSNYFVNLEKHAYERKHIGKLKTKENIYLEEPNKILWQMGNFYEALYSQISEDTFNASAPHFLNCNIKRLDGQHQKICEGLITKEECLSALKQFSKNKTPGSDGLTVEFYLCFWDYVAAPLKDCLNEAYKCGEMSISQKRGVISLLPPKNKDTLPLKYFVEH